jgi:hypothetical protein
MKAVIVCREMSWSWHEYREQPQWFITMLLSMLQNEAEETKRKAKQ